MYSTAGLNSHASAVYGGIPAPTNVTFQVYLSFVITENSSESSTVDGWSKKSSMHAFASKCCASGCSSSAGPKLEDQSTC
jgi:hypothetical protein